ncbi:MAG: amino acid adenylation domain-containing protein [Thermoanaerobaculia bacterium]
MSRNALHRSILAHARARGGAVALEESGGETWTYRELERRSASVAAWLAAAGVRAGDRVGLCLPKSNAAVAAILGTLRAGAAYVPVDPEGPPERNAYVLDDCRIAALVGTREAAARPAAELARRGRSPAMLFLSSDEWSPAARAPAVETGGEELAYILYTSGSTGRPKGVPLSHGNALAFVGWCAETFQPTPEDRFSSHAPLHFDLSIFDLFVGLGHGAAVVLIGAAEGRQPRRLAELISGRKITVWYSGPSALVALVEFGELERHDCRPLRLVLFAGDVFPNDPLRRLRRCLPHPRMFNLYGPTESNVCTYYELPGRISPLRRLPIPIGKPCSHFRAKVVDRRGREVRRGRRGELCVAGTAVMRGYWNPSGSAPSPFLDDDASGRWYRTGDIVRETSDGLYLFHGRRDRMVKKRGHRVELGEIEFLLARHPSVVEAAVVATPHAEQGVLLHAFLVPRPDNTISVLEIKAHCARRLPLAMVPDRVVSLSALPLTSTGKTDYRGLLALIESPTP